jgi:hypothetical protein
MAQSGNQGFKPTTLSSREKIFRNRPHKGQHSMTIDDKMQQNHIIIDNDSINTAASHNTSFIIVGKAIEKIGMRFESRHYY